MAFAYPSPLVQRAARICSETLPNTTLALRRLEALMASATTEGDRDAIGGYIEGVLMVRAVASMRRAIARKNKKHKKALP